ncbi:DUF6421 family protein [Streptomyces sp. NBC_01619]|uniref:DUF6421 family protein n=1 Tax=Streptomyces sp. NBC_01619 TaxID=2975901 RepID=UPI002258B4A0|nr:DUF6421 family protein [Streptomyces sp. NBC_01619]MCX4516017.1 DUF6421 family protein [Streptomyces sp. NBC_01619]
MPSAVIAEVNQIREKLKGARGDFRDQSFLDRLAQEISTAPNLGLQSAAQALVGDLRSFLSEPYLKSVKRHINNEEDRHIFSLFDASYFPSLSLEYLTYETLPTNSRLATRYASKTMPVNIIESSSGFASRVVVALFPENHLDGRQGSDDLIFYFINKFVERHNRITRRMIDVVMAEDGFPSLRDADDRAVEQASSWWVQLHEYHHHQGDMPIPEFLSTKKLKPLAGLEELRADVSSMLVCLNDDSLPAPESQLAYEYILSERLLCYAVEGIPRPNYDAVASQLLFNYLSQNGGLRLERGRVHLDARLPAILAMFLSEIERIEQQIHTHSAQEVQKKLLEFTNRHTDYDEQSKDYRHIPYFAEIKDRLGV